MKIGFIGAGKVGQSFGILLNAKNIPITGYYSKSKRSAEEASIRIHTKAYDTLKQLVIDSDIIAITVTDDQIDSIISEIDALNIKTDDKMFFHMSGVQDSVNLSRISSHVFSLHPLKAFPEIIDSYHAFDGIYFSLEGADEMIRNWINQLDITFFEIDKSQKAQYHSAAVIVSNYLVSVIDFGMTQLELVGLPKALAQKALWPLVTNTIENIEKMGTKNALTGPIVRGDRETIQKHLDVLNSDSKVLYRALGKYTLSLSKHDLTHKQQLSRLFEEEKNG